MEKRRVSYPLPRVHRLIKEHRQNCRLTMTAQKTAHKLGYSETEALESILLLEAKDFSKSTTENYNNHVWQDVYKKRFGKTNIYIKLKVIKIEDDELLVLSFKEDEQFL